MLLSREFPNYALGVIITDMPGLINVNKVKTLVGC